MNRPAGAFAFSVVSPRLFHFSHYWAAVVMLPGHTVVLLGGSHPSRGFHGFHGFHGLSSPRVGSHGLHGSTMPSNSAPGGFQSPSLGASPYLPPPRFATTPGGTYDFQSPSPGAFSYGPPPSATDRLPPGMSGIRTVSTAPDGTPRVPPPPPPPPPPTRHYQHAHAQSSEHAALPPRHASQPRTLLSLQSPQLQSPQLQSLQNASVVGLLEIGRSSSFSGARPQAMGSVASRVELTTGPAVVQALAPQAPPAVADLVIPCFACGKTNVGTPCFLPTNRGWTVIAIVCLDGACADLWRCSSSARICKQALAYTFVTSVIRSVCVARFVMSRR